MSQTIGRLCETDGTCPRPGHGKYIYFCKPCHDEWEEQNPHAARALRNPGVDRNSLQAAKKKDQQLRSRND